MKSAKAKFMAWLESQYLAKNIPFVPRKGVQKMVSEMNFLYSSVVRLNTIRFSPVLAISRVAMYVTVFTLHSMGEHTNIAFLYSRKIRKNDTKRMKQRVAEKFVNVNFCISPSLVSCDGEYRRRFNVCKSIKVIPQYFSNEWHAIEQVVRKKVERKGWTVIEKIYYPTDKDKKSSDGLLKSFQKDGLTMFFLQASWLVNTLEHLRGIQENHINKTYQRIMLSDMESDAASLKKIMTDFGEGPIELIYNVLTHANADRSSKINHNFVELGQKMIPLNIAEVQTPFDLMYKPWKEFLISNRIADLVATGIACGFSCITKWLYIKNSEKGLFDNEIQYDRMEKGKMAKEIAQLLANARDRSVIDAKIQEEAASMLVDKFAHLRGLIQKPIDFCKEEIIMSNVVLCIVSEYVGKTYLDSIVICKRSKYYRDLMGDPFGEGFELFRRHIFELIYNLYCLNRYFGVIHGDLHLNNVTMRRKKVATTVKFSDVKDPKILFVVDDLQFLFPTTDFSTCLIDFSRSSIHHDNFDMFNIKHMEKHFKSTKHAEQIDQMDRARLIHLYVNTFPDMGEHKAAIMALFEQHYDETYKLLTLLDVHNFCNKALTLFKSGVKSVSKGTKKHVAFLTEVVKTAESILRTEMNKLLFDPQYYPTVTAMELPNLTLMKKIFGGDIVGDAPQKGSLVDVFVARDTPLDSIDSFEVTPERYAIVKGFDATKEEKAIYNKMNKTRKNIARNIELNTVDAVKTVKLISRRHMEKNLL